MWIISIIHKITNHTDLYDKNLTSCFEKALAPIPHTFFSILVKKYLNF